MGMVRTLIALVFVAVATQATAQQQQPVRVALIIANSAYAQQPALANPARDAEAVRAALTRAGFQATISANRTKAQMEADLVAFRRRADAAEVSLIYFAGHGMRVGQTNWLLPVDFDATGIATEEDFESFALSHRTILRQLGASPTRIAVFDACRDNPYEAAIMARMSLAARSATVPARREVPVAQPGLAPIEADNVLVLFSAGAGQFALDGAQGQISPFAKAFTESVVTQTELRVMAGAVRDKVVEATGGERSRNAQRPYLSGSLGGREIYLMGAVVRVAPIGEEAAAFAKCNTEQSAACWRDYVARYPGGNNVSTAKIVLSSLERPAGPLGAPDTDSVDATRRALAAMTQAELNRGDYMVLSTRLIAQHGKANLERAAQLGDARAQWLLGMGYRYGLGGFPVDWALAVRWFKASSADGFARAQAFLGSMYALGESVEANQHEATRLYRLAVAQGDALAQAVLGQSYYYGTDATPQDEREAVRLYRLAVAQGNPLGQANLGVAYDEAKGGLVRDEREALRLFRLAADQGDSGGQANLGLMYEEGRGGVTANRQEAVRLYRLAAQKRNGFAQRQLSRLGETW